jgi:amino acid adenylation domain-containing protein
MCALSKSQEIFDIPSTQYAVNSTQVAGEIDNKLPSLVPDLLVAQAKARPQALAVRSGQDQITFAELDHYSNHLAHRMRSLGVGRDVLVGICLRRSTVMVVAALAVLKAGGAYVPLDADWPSDRIAYMVKGAQAPVVITDRCIAHRMPSEAQLILLDNDPRSVGEGPSDCLAQTATADNLAYVIYTSGSTGKPKAVDVTHGNLLNLMNWHQRAFEITPKDRTTQLASLGFDAAAWEIWPNLTAGASVHLPDDELRNSPEKLRDWLVANEITVTFVPTPVAEQLIVLPWPKETALRLMLTGADVLHRYPPAGLPFVLVNNYGPAECTVVSTSAPVLPQEARNTLPAIGRPIDALQIHILDEKMRPVGQGETGEIYIGGGSVARGYHNDPELTASRFVPDPFSDSPKARLYRTGDQGCWLADGQIAFQGRIDQMIKIRGFRIEPNEIIAALGTHSSVRESTVVGRDHHGDKRLIAYVVPRAGQEVTLISIRKHLERLLPDYMCPSVFVLIHSLPLTTNGKIDVTALPLPADNNTIRDCFYVAPVTDIEERVSRILANVLGVENVGRDDNFFLLGGHSLLGVQVLAKLQKTFGVQISLKQLFENPTLAQLSIEVERLLASSSASGSAQAQPAAI